MADQSRKIGEETNIKMYRRHVQNMKVTSLQSFP